MFGCSDVYHWMGRPRRRSACRTADVLALKSHNLDATTFWSAPQISATLPSGIADSARHRRVRFVETPLRLPCADRSYRRWRWSWPEEGIWLLARGSVHLWKGDVTPSNAIRRGEIVKEIADHAGVGSPGSILQPIRRGFEGHTRRRTAGVAQRGRANVPLAASGCVVAGAKAHHVRPAVRPSVKKQVVASCEIDVSR